MKRITGTHVYTFAKCPRAVALELHGDPAAKRPWSEIEELALRRGRELEDRLCADLGWPEPEYAERDFEAGAAATRALLAEGVRGVRQGVLLDGTRLGIADLLRRVEGESALGGWHYEVGDVKSSRMPRGDQVLQVMFYSRLLCKLQGRAPDSAYLVLRDGREERFACADYDAVLEDVEARIAALREQRAVARPCLGPMCAGCCWSELCLPELRAARDLSLLQGMTGGLREMLEAAGICDTAAAAAMSVEAVARRSRLEPVLLRRVRKAARAHCESRLLVERPPAIAKGPAAIAHLLIDAFAERVLWIGVLFPASEDGQIMDAAPLAAEDELAEFAKLIEALPPEATLWHYGATLPRWHDEASWRARRLGHELETRFADLARCLHGAAVYPRPVFGLDDHVALVLERDPHRAGDRRAAALWAMGEDGAQRLRAKGRADLLDLAALRAALVETAPAVGSAPGRGAGRARRAAQRS